MPDLPVKPFKIQLEEPQCERRSKELEIREEFHEKRGRNWSSDVRSRVRLPEQTKEDTRLLDGYKVYGRKWSRFKASLPGRTADSMKNRFGELTRFAEMARRDPGLEMSLANGTHASAIHAIHAVSSLVSTTSLDRRVALSKRLIRTAAVSAAFGTVVGRSISNHNMTFIGSGVLRSASKQSTCFQVASHMPGTEGTLAAVPQLLPAPDTLPGANSSGSSHTMVALDTQPDEIEIGRALQLGMARAVQYGSTRIAPAPAISADPFGLRLLEPDLPVPAQLRSAQSSNHSWATFPYVKWVVPRLLPPATLPISDLGVVPPLLNEEPDVLSSAGALSAVSDSIVNIAGADAPSPVMQPSPAVPAPVLPQLPETLPSESEQPSALENNAGQNSEEDSEEVSATEAPSFALSAQSGIRRSSRGLSVLGISWGARKSRCFGGFLPQMPGVGNYPDAVDALMALAQLAHTSSAAPRTTR